MIQFLTQDHPDISHAMMAERACLGGIRWVQFRKKTGSEEEILAEALEVQAICRRYGAKFIVNDYLELASTINADGVHLGLEDGCAGAARMLLGTYKIIGGTCHSWEDIEQRHREGVDYIGLGPFRFTHTKQNLAEILGLEGYVALIAKRNQLPSSMPIIAIGGIQVEDCAALKQAGLAGVAVSSAINLAENPSAVAAQFLAAWNLGEIQNPTQILSRV